MTTSRSTDTLAGETLCAFLNGENGKVLIGVGPDGRLLGQEVAGITLRDIASAPSRQFAPFVFESKPYKHVGSTTR